MASTRWRTLRATRHIGSKLRYQRSSRRPVPRLAGYSYRGVCDLLI